MNLRSGFFILVASAACLCATESESKAQGLQRGGQFAARIARTYATRSVPGLGVARVVQRGVRFGRGQGFRGATPRFGNRFGVRNGLQATRIIRRFVN